MTDLDERARCVEVTAGSTLVGLRLRPGARIHVDRLLDSLRNREPDRDVVTYLGEACVLSRPVASALDALAAPRTDVETAARDLGVSTRTLERVVREGTGKTPAFFVQLARVRRAARDLAQEGSFAEIAFRHGFADQAHFTRAIRRWLGTTPSKLKSDVRTLEVLAHSGYP